MDNNTQPMMMTKTPPTTNPSSTPPPTSISKLATSGCCDAQTTTLLANNNIQSSQQHTRRLSSSTCVVVVENDRNNCCNDFNQHQPPESLFDANSNKNHLFKSANTKTIIGTSHADDKMRSDCNNDDGPLVVVVESKKMLIDRMAAEVVATKDIESSAVEDNHNQHNQHHHHHDHNEESDCEAEAAEADDTDDTVVVRDETSGCVHYKRKAKFVVSTD